MHAALQVSTVQYSTCAHTDVRLAHAYTLMPVVYSYGRLSCRLTPTPTPAPLYTQHVHYSTDMPSVYTHRDLTRLDARTLTLPISGTPSPCTTLTLPCSTVFCSTNTSHTTLPETCTAHIWCRRVIGRCHHVSYRCERGIGMSPRSSTVRLSSVYVTTVVRGCMGSTTKSSPKSWSCIHTNLMCAK
jgi:hypothetical protein